MADVTLQGVWLLDEDALLGLDEILQSKMKELTSKRKKHIAASVKTEVAEIAKAYHNEEEAAKAITEFKEELMDRHPEPELSITLYDKKGGVRINGFRQCFMRDDLKDRKPKQFQVEIASKNSRISIDLTTKHGFGSTMTISARPKAAFENTASHDLRRWAEQHRCPHWVNQWSGKSLASAFVILFGSALVFAIVNLAVESKYRDPEIARANQIVDEGVNDRNRNAAIQILLELATNKWKSQPTGSGRLVGLPWLLIPLAFIVLAFLCPTSVLGIGNGKTSIAWQRLWIAWSWGALVAIFGGTLVAYFHAKILKLIGI
jgi:hypothetical protein